MAAAAEAVAAAAAAFFIIINRTLSFFPCRYTSFNTSHPYIDKIPPVVGFMAGLSPLVSGLEIFIVNTGSSFSSLDS